VSQLAAGEAAGEPPTSSPSIGRGFWVYVAAVAAGGPAVALVLALTNRAEIAELGAQKAALAALLTVAAAAASRFRLHIGHQVHVNVSTAASVAMLILLPLPLPGLLAPLAKLAAELAPRRRRADPVEVAFNVGQTAWCASMAALTFAAVDELLPGAPARLEDLTQLLATAAAFLTLHLANTGLVAGIAGLQLRYDPFRLWLVSFRESLLAHATLATVAFAAALLVDDHPLALAAMFLPLALVHRALRASAQLREDTHAALASLVEVVELRDPYTAGHSRRVAETARQLALRLGFSPEEADHLESAGRVHDIGKVAIDPLVLTKPGKLDPVEWAEMRRHPELGAEVIARFAAYGDGFRLVRHHHEAWDGSGYPDGLAGEAIPLGARILAVADTFDALTSDRPYRSRLDLDRAVAILREGAGRQWDPVVVAALLAHLGVESVEAPVAAPVVNRAQAAA
jgi:HD-GYP domain-containing protein (c-di-GMP phosphodiesterase class II)